MRKAKFITAGALSLMLLTACGNKEQKAIEFAKSGTEYLEAGDYDTARIQFQNAMSKDYENIEAHLGLAEIAMRQKDYRSVVSNMKAILNVDADHYEANISLSQIALLTKDKDNALKYSEAALRGKPGDANALSLKAAALILDNKNEEARKIARQVQKEDPSNAEVYNVLAADQMSIENFEEAMAILDEGITKVKDPQSLLLVKLVLSERIRGDEGVMAVFATLIKRYPENLMYKIQRAEYAGIKMKDYNLARQYYEEIIPQSDDKTGLQMRLAEFDYYAGDIDRAIERINDFIASDPTNFNLYFSRADLFCKSSQVEKCRAGLEAIRKDAPDVEDKNKARNSLAYMALVEKDIETARVLANEVRALDPTNPNALIISARILLVEEKYDDAINTLREALEQEPDNARAMVLLAGAYDRTGNDNFANAQYAKALDASKDNRVIAQAYESFLLRRNDGEGAVEIANKFLENNPGDIPTMVFLTQTQIALGQENQARISLERLRQFDPSNAKIPLLEAGILLLEQRYPQAITMLERLSAEDPNNMRISSQLVDTYLRLNQYDNAERFLNESIAKDGGNLRQRKQYAEVLLRSGKPTQAETVIKKLQKDAPEDDGTHILMYRAKIALGQKAGAIPILRDGLTKASRQDRLNILLSSELIDTGEFEEAIRILRILNKQFPGQDVIANNLANMLMETSTDPVDLQEALDIAIRFRNSESGYYLDTLAWAYFKTGDKQKAQLFSKQAVHALPDNAEVQYHHGIISYENADPVEGRKALELTLQISGEDHRAIDRELIQKYLTGQ